MAKKSTGIAARVAALEAMFFSMFSDSGKAKKARAGVKSKASVKKRKAKKAKKTTRKKK